MSDDTSTDTAWVSLGTNMGHRGGNLGRLREALTAGGVTLAAASPEILTRPVGVTAQGDFHNQVVRLRVLSRGHRGAGSSTPGTPKSPRDAGRRIDGDRASRTPTS